MKRKLFTRAVVPLAAVAVGACIASPASASQLCTNDPTNPLPSPVFVVGATSVQNFIKTIQKALAGTTSVIYLGNGSCAGVYQVFNSTAATPATLGTGTALYWDTATNAQANCTLNNELADVAISDVYWSSCTAPDNFSALPASVNENFGAIQVMNFIVPASATGNTVLSAQAAYLIYGFGAATGFQVGPYTDPTVIFQRGYTSGTQAELAVAIGVPANQWLPLPGDGGLPNEVSGGSTGMLNAVANSADPNATIGVLASDTTDGTTAGVDGGAAVSNRTRVSILAFQGYNQECAWLPDSSATTYDKINVREGHYMNWGPTHFYTQKTGLKAAAAALVGYFDGTVAPPVGVNILDLEILDHQVPQCAMKVQRSTEIGDISPYTSPTPCGCYFEETLSPGSSGCTACVADGGADAGACTTGTCSYGFCEGT